MKMCPKCKLSLPASKFNKGNDRQGLASYCRSCTSAYYKSRSMSRRRHLGPKYCKMCKVRITGKSAYCKPCNSFIGHKNNITRYGISVDQYAELLVSQGGVCAICGGKDSKRLSVDHDHSCCAGTGSCGKCIRGLLCSHCNKTLGLARDNPEILRSMVDYLIKPKLIF